MAKKSTNSPAATIFITSCVAIAGVAYLAASRPASTSTEVLVQHNGAAPSDAAQGWSDAAERDDDQSPSIDAPTATQAVPEAMHYNVSDDPDQLELVGLDTIAGGPDATTVNVVQLWRGDNRHGLIQTWEIDCPRSTMRTVRLMAFDATGSSPERSLQGEMISTRGSASSRLIAQLACSGEGSLQQDRVFRGPLRTVVDNFWKR